jgi:hypothetical protein
MSALAMARLRRVALAAAILAAATGAAFGALGDAGAQAPADPLTPPQARALAAALQASTTLPGGANFNGIRWEEAGGTFTDGDVAFVTQYNAACQWWRALADGRQAAVAAEVVQALPGWSALRDTEPGHALAQAAGEVAGGGAPGTMATALVAQCRASHEREVQWAQRLGLPPST